MIMLCHKLQCTMNLSDHVSECVSKLNHAKLEINLETLNVTKLISIINTCSVALLWT